jgi:periplasmic protein TonB
MAAGICVLGLHGLLVWALISEFSVQPPVPPPAMVQVSLLPKKLLPKFAPLTLPRFSQQPQIVAIAPVVTVAQPPPPDTIRAVPPAHAPAPSMASPGPAKPAPPPSDYLSRLEAHLNAYKYYPADARIHHLEGTVQLRFSLDRAGHVLSFDVVESSGSETLDNEVRDMVRRADPFPPMPADYRGETLDLTVPVVFAVH